MILLIDSQLNVLDQDMTACNIQNVIIDENTGELLNIETRFRDSWLEQTNIIEPIKKEEFNPEMIWRIFMELSDDQYKEFCDKPIETWEHFSDKEYIYFEFSEDGDFGITASIGLHRYLFEKHMFKFVQIFKFDTIIYKPEGNVRGAYLKTSFGEEYMFERRNYDG